LGPLASLSGFKRGPEPIGLKQVLSRHHQPGELPKRVWLLERSGLGASSACLAAEPRLDIRQPRIAPSIATRRPEQLKDRPQPVDGLTISCPVSLPLFDIHPSRLRCALSGRPVREMSHAKPQPPIHCACCRISPCGNGFDVDYSRPSPDAQTPSCLRHYARGDALLGF
jgi:hypothetical protein